MNRIVSEVGLISIIIPTYNRAQIILDCLNSVSAQSYANFECIIVDDFSVDNTFEVIETQAKSDMRFKFLTNKNAKGAPGARNTGLDVATGDFIMFLDSDDLLGIDCLKNRSKPFLTQDLDMVVSFQQKIIDGVKEKIINIPTANENLVRFFSFVPNCDVPWINNTLIKKEFLKNNNIRWNEDLMLYQDIQFNLALLSHEPKVSWEKSIDSYWVFNSKTKETIGKSRDQWAAKHIKLLDIYTQYYLANKLRNKVLAMSLLTQFNACSLFLILQIIRQTSQRVSLRGMNLDCFKYLSIDSRILLIVFNHCFFWKANVICRKVSSLIERYLKRRNKPFIEKENFCRYTEEEISMKQAICKPN
jgi:glycosyltransferase involved in cell wall biosynthesis